MFKDIAYELNKDLDHVSGLIDLARDAFYYYVESHSERFGGRNADNTKKIVEIYERFFLKRK